MWEPHDHQKLVKNALFSEGKKVIFLECGRKYGKTDILCYILYRFAMMFPNSACYYIAPFQKQAREIIWANGRLANFFMPLIDPVTRKTHLGHTRAEAFDIYEALKEKYIKSINDQEMRIKFHNGSFIKLDGADNHQAYRGISPHILVYDEFKDHNPKFHTGMDPNLAAFDAPLVVVGTPPEGDESNEQNFYSMADYAKTDENQAYFNAPTYVNPYISRDFLARKKKEHKQKNEYDKWLREYMAKRVRSGSKTIFPMFEPPEAEEGVIYTKHVKPHREVIAPVVNRLKDWDIVVAYDPASVTTFGTLFVATHKYTKQVRVFSEVYAQGMASTSTDQVFPESLSKLEKERIPTDCVDMIYDHAAQWFANEVHYRYEGFGLSPCVKDYNTKKDKISLIKDMLLAPDGMFWVSEECVHFISEMTNYRTDDKGKIIKKDDHLIDCFRYILNFLEYIEVPQIPRDPALLPENQRFIRPQEETMDSMEDPWQDLAIMA